MSREQTKAAYYIQQLDEARCNGNWDTVPELVRKIRKHAPTRACLTLTAEAEHAVTQATLARPTTARPGSDRPSTANSQPSPIAKYIPRLLDVIENERTHVEDEFQGQVCLGWIHWHLGEHALAAGRLPKNIEQEFAQLDGTNKDSAGWTKVCALKAAYVKGISQVRTGYHADALQTFESSLPIFASVSTHSNETSQLKTWTELYLTGFSMVSSQSTKLDTTSILETETLSAFRTWAKFWDAQTAKSVGGRAPGAEVSRRQVWKEYYIVLSNLLYDDLPFPTTILTTTYASSSTKFQQRTELKRVEARYKTLLLSEVHFPKAEEINEEVEEFVELVMQNWRTLCGSRWKDEDLGEGGAEAFSRDVLDTLYDAATKTFHSAAILRHLFTVHLAVADFDLGFKAFDTYLEIVKKGKLRVEKTGEPEPGLDDDETVLRAASDCIKALCRYGSKDGAEKAHELGVYFESWLEKQHPVDKTNGNGKAIENGASSQSNPEFTPKVLALAWRSIGIAHAQWARFTYDAGSRTDIQLHAIKCFRKALHPKYESQTDVETLFALGTLLAERRDLSSAIEVVKSGLQPPQSSPGNAATGLGPESGPFARERSLIPLWHLLALLLSARQEFITAARACEGAFEQFHDPRNLFGDASLSTPFRSDHLKPNEKSGSRVQGIVDDMDDFERENVLEVKMTQLALIEVLEGPDVAVNASDELLGLYARLFGDPQKDIMVPKRPETAAPIPPKSSAGTIRSIKGSIFGRSSRSVRKAQTAPAGGDRSNVAMRPQTSQTPASVRAPVIQVTNENGSTGKQHHEHHHLHKDPPQDKPNRTTSLSKKRASGSTRTRSTSAGRIDTDHRITIVDGEKFFTPPADAQHKDQWLDEGQPGTSIPSRSASVKDKSNSTTSRPLPPNSQQMYQKEKSLQSASSDPSKNQDDRLPRVSSFSSATTPITRFPKDQERRRRSATLIKVWLLIAGFYRRASMYEDARGAIEEAHKLAQNLELHVENDGSGNVSISNSGWGGGKSVGQLLGDVFSERGYLALAESSPYPALAHFETSLTHFGDHPSAIVGLSNILLDIYSEDLLPPPLLAPLVLPDNTTNPSASTLSTITPVTTASTSLIQSTPTHGPLGLSHPQTKPRPQTAGSSTPSGLSSLAPSPSKESSTALLDRLAARDRAYGLLSMLTKLGLGWNNSEAWFALARAYELGGQVDKAKEVLWWCVAVKFLVINMTKTLAMVQGAILQGLSPFTLNGKPVNFTNEYSYVGMTFVSDARNIFAQHYARKEKSARAIANVIFSVETFVGSLPPFQGKRLYNARVDPHLTAGCEVALDVDMHLLKPLQKVQRTFLQRLIGLNPRAMRVFCFSESGIIPLAYRRIILAVRYLQYILSRPQEQLVACALRECELLHAAGAPSWLGDLSVVINRIPTNWTRPLWSPLGLDVEATALLIADITSAARLHVQEAIDQSSKGLLLRGRLHADEDGTLVPEPIAFRLYLSVTDPKHRKALAGLLLADSPLAEAKLRMADERGRRQKIPREWRLCRLCMADVEDTLHALFVCGGSSELNDLRTGLWRSCVASGENVATLRRLAPWDILQRMLLSKRLVPILAEYA